MEFMKRNLHLLIAQVYLQDIYNQLAHYFF